MTLRELLQKFGPRPLQGKGKRPIDTVDAAGQSLGGQTADGRGHVPAPAPTNWVPSQQDERPRH
jgi:hypothetical protein